MKMLLAAVAMTTIALSTPVFAESGAVAPPPPSFHSGSPFGDDEMDFDTPYSDSQAYYGDEYRGFDDDYGHTSEPTLPHATPNALRLQGTLGNND
jgi:hypothetical protein